ncbi:hypothetical protein M407DRAFT_32547 [Tulasnella calospora MUT 4182]|uniref:superoxide dismutase n=1 Tax=Tulasnella calospora MUT 4182 TaxID=1051891 RepID=A0A0C3PSS1_9AGAM|nr:hypothetical protein M407DRAFT_32547 [Tulasnella calospora MUT 4182]
MFELNPGLDDVIPDITFSYQLNPASGSAALHTLPDLPYGYDALEPHICKETSSVIHMELADAEEDHGLRNARSSRLDLDRIVRRETRLTTYE